MCTDGEGTFVHLSFHKTPTRGIAGLHFSLVLSQCCNNCDDKDPEERLPYQNLAVLIVSICVLNVNDCIWPLWGCITGQIQRAFYRQQWRQQRHNRAEKTLNPWALIR